MHYKCCPPQDISVNSKRCYVTRQHVFGYMFLMHANVYSSFKYLDRIQGLDLVYLQFSDRPVGGVPGQISQVRAGVASGQLGNLESKK